jgi:hypothetical protein
VALRDPDPSKSGCAPTFQDGNQLVWHAFTLFLIEKFHAGEPAEPQGLEECERPVPQDLGKQGQSQILTLAQDARHRGSTAWAFIVGAKSRPKWNSYYGSSGVVCTDEGRYEVFVPFNYLEPLLSDQILRTRLSAQDL